MNTSVHLLKVAADIAGGVRELAERLEISERLLERFMEGVRPLPDFLVLRAVDVVLEDRQSRTPSSSTRGQAALGNEAQ